ncbi:MAG: ATP synthase F1 subunit gamma [Clostridia bacterium]|nr:ATP synthase F1 subunit gamma [Clostridia bacterium]
MKSIKNRIKSVESTMSITKAMELVATSKLRKAKAHEEAVKPFFRLLEATIADIIRSGSEKNIYIHNPAAVPKTDATCYVVIAGDRGLAGGYNNNLFRMVREQIKDGDYVIPVGKKSIDYYAKQPYGSLTKEFSLTAEVSVPEAVEISSILCSGYLEGKFSHVVIAFTNFVSMLAQEPELKTLLPLDKEKLLAESQTDETGDEKKILPDTIYEPSPEAVLSRIIPQYISGMVYGAVCEAQASEFAARRSSMSAANKNAGEMIDNLTLYYNRARQAMITQEITEIVAGSNT